MITVMMASHTGSHICDNCGNEIRDGTVHRKDEDGRICAVHDILTEQPRGFSSRRIPVRRMYKN